MIVKYLLVY